MVFQISSSVKGVSRSDISNRGMFSSSKLTVTSRSKDSPRRWLYKWWMLFSFSSWLVSKCPSSETSLQINCFLLRCLAWKWNRAVLASPSESQVIRDRLLAIVRCSEDRAKECFLSWSLSHFSCLDSNLASCAISSWCRTSLARPNWELT